MVMAAFLLLGECISQTTERVESPAPHVGKSSAEVSVAPLLEAVHQLTVAVPRNPAAVCDTVTMGFTHGQQL